MKRPKYGNKHVELDGIKFASKKERNRYSELKILERGGVISDLKLQQRFNIIHNGIKICAYVSDFTYFENGEFVVEDTKGYLTDVYKLKKKMMLAFHSIKIRET